jgi:hypothetical protein
MKKSTVTRGFPQGSARRGAGFCQGCITSSLILVAVTALIAAGALTKAPSPSHQLSTGWHETAAQVWELRWVARCKRLAGCHVALT